MKKINLNNLLEEEDVRKIKEGNFVDTTNGEYRWSNIFKNIEDRLYNNKEKEVIVYKGEIAKMHGGNFLLRKYGTDDIFIIIVHKDRIKENINDKYKELLRGEYLFAGKNIVFSAFGSKEQEDNYSLLNTKDIGVFSQTPFRFPVMIKNNYQQQEKE